MPSPLPREPSNTSSIASSLNDSAPPTAGGSALDLSTTPNAGTDTPQSSTNEPFLNFRSLAAMIGEEDEEKIAPGRESDHIEHAESTATTTSATNGLSAATTQATRQRGDSGESSSSSFQPAPPSAFANDAEDDNKDAIQSVPSVMSPHGGVESKSPVDVNVLDHSGGQGYGATQ